RHCLGLGRSRASGGQGHRRRHSGGRERTILRKLFPRLDGPEHQGHGPRALDRAVDRRGTRWHNLGAQPRWCRNDCRRRPAVEDRGGRSRRGRRRGGDSMTDDAVEREQPVVLAADDDEDILELIAFRLERSGYTVLQARDGQEALELARTSKPDLAVLDVMMPKIDGFELTRRLREDDLTTRMPIILLTARTQEADVKRGFDAGADDYIRKPFSPQELRARVQAILGRR